VEATSARVKGGGEIPTAGAGDQILADQSRLMDEMRALGSKL